MKGMLWPPRASPPRRPAPSLAPAFSAPPIPGPAPPSTSPAPRALPDATPLFSTAPRTGPAPSVPGPAPSCLRLSQASPSHLAGPPAFCKLASVVIGHVLAGGAADRIVVLEHGHRLICRQMVSRVGSPQDSRPPTPRRREKSCAGRLGS